MSWKPWQSYPKEEKEKKLAVKKLNIKSVKTVAAEKGLTHGINILNLTETVYKAENESIQGEENTFGNDS